MEPNRVEINIATLAQRSITEHMPGVLTWLQSEGHDLSEVRHMTVGQDMAIKSQEHASSIGWQEYEPVGTYPVSLTFADESTIHRVFLRNELFPSS